MNTNTHFVIGIRNKIPYKISGPDYIVTDNSDYTLELVPDEQWEGMETKTVIYAYDNGTAIHNPIKGNQDIIPVIQASGNLHIGVTAGDIRTSTWVSVPIRGSIRLKAGAGINPPAPDVYDKIMDMIGKQTGIKSVEIQEGSVTDEGGVGETPVYYLVITEKSGKIFKEKLPNFEVDPKQIVKLQNGAPTEETEGIQNQLLINKDDWTIYVCTGAVLVMGEYTYFWQQIGGTGGSGDVGTDITLGITRAVVGQTAKITEVDENGKPVKWEAADIPAQTDIDSTLSIEGSAADAKSVGDKLTEVSRAIAEQGKMIPKVFPWANAELPFTESEISGTASGAGFVVNPENFADGKTYFRYHAGATNFTWTNPNPKVGAVTLRVLSWKQWDKNSNDNSSSLNILYGDGTTDNFVPLNGVISTFNTNANKVLSQIKGNYDIENWILLDMDVLSIVADYPAPTGTVKTVNGVEPDENGNVEIAIPEGGGSGGTDISLGMAGAAVGQIARITAVDAAGVPTAWEAADEIRRTVLCDFTAAELVVNPIIGLSDNPFNYTMFIVDAKLTMPEVGNPMFQMWLKNEDGREVQISHLQNIASKSGTKLKGIVILGKDRECSIFFKDEAYQWNSTAHYSEVYNVHNTDSNKENALVFTNSKLQAGDYIRIEGVRG